MPASRYDAVIVGGGHNGLVAAAYLARAGRRVVLLERMDHLGGAAVSERPFPGVDARLSRYAYLVSLLPRQVARELGLRIELRRRRVSSYTPVGDGGVLDPDLGDWDAMTARIAQRVFPTLTEPLRSREALRAVVADDAAWEAVFERPLGEAVERAFSDDTIRGIVLTDALIGTFASAHDPRLVQNRCFLYHVVGNGTGDWDVPVGGMGAVSGALAQAAGDAGAVLRTGAQVVSIAPDGEVRLADGSAVAGERVLANVAPAVLARLLGEEPAGPAPEGAQLKVNMVLARLPRLRDAAVDPRDAFAGTLHVNEGYAQLQRAYEQAAAGLIPDLPPCEIYCHSLTDPSILGPELQAAGAQTLTLFGLHMPARLFGTPGAKDAAVQATLRSLDAVLAEPIEDCLWRTPEGQPCLDARTPLELEAELALPAGHIFHRDLAWPYAETEEEVGRWGVETHHERILLCGAGAKRGGGVSGIPGRNAAMAALRAAAPRA
jgi:phytoene dehydrogenase-like protein